MLSECEGYPSRAVMAQYNVQSTGTGMGEAQSMAVGGAHTGTGGAWGTGMGSVQGTAAGGA